MIRIVVASANPVKVKATLDAFSQMFPAEKFTVESVDVGSGVDEQPSSDQETLEGAINRAINASKAVPEANYFVGIEGGIDTASGDMESFAWMVIQSKDGKIGRGRTATFILPKKVAELVNGGMELGTADDIVFDRKNSKQANGAAGLLTNDVITRASYYTEALIFALIPFNKTEYY